MSDHLQELLAKARSVAPTPEQEERQRLSFVYGTLKIEDGAVTRADVERVLQELDRQELNRRGAEPTESQQPVR